MAQQIFVNNVDQTAELEQKTVTIKTQLNNKPDSFSCRFLNFTPADGQEVEYYLGGKLVQAYSSGVSSMVVDDLMEYEEVFRAGDEVFLSPNTVSEEIITILTVTTATKTITFTRPTRKSHADKALLGKKLFGGIILKTPEDDLGYAGDTTAKIKARDYSVLFNRKLVVESFEDQYPLEIISRINNEFVSDDLAERILDTCDTADWTESGVAIAETTNTDRVIGNFSLNLGASGAGVATYEKTFTPVDMTGYDRQRIWLKVIAGNILKMTSFKLRMGTDSSNYYEWEVTPSDLSEDCWLNWTSKNNNFTTETGTINLSSVGYVAVIFTATGPITLGDIRIDSVTGNAGGFSVNNVERGPRVFDDTRIQYKKCTVSIEKLSKLLGYFWYIDYNKDLYFFPQNEHAAPLNIEAGVTKNYRNLKITPDISQIKNRQTIRGGEAPSAATYEQKLVNDGQMTSWPLDYKPKDFEIAVDSGGGFVVKTVGVENLVDETTVDYVYNFNEKFVRTASAATPADGDILRFRYLPFKPIRVRASHPGSISSMAALTGGDGIFDGTMITDLGIQTFNEARERANAELNAYANPIITINFSTDQQGLRAGQLLSVKDTSRNVDDSFLVQSVSAKQVYNHRFEYKVQCASTLFGIIEFFQLLLQKTDDLLIGVDEIVDIIVNDDEVINLDEEYTLTKLEAPWYATGDGPSPSTSQDAIVGFCEVN